MQFNTFCHKNKCYQRRLAQARLLAPIYPPLFLRLTPDSRQNGKLAKVFPPAYHDKRKMLETELFMLGKQEIDRKSAEFARSTANCFISKMRKAYLKLYLGARRRSFERFSTFLCF
jgi:hypothetical protein